jgi:hypothetical protein
MHAAACATPRAPGRRSSRSDINWASMSGTPPACGAAPALRLFLDERDEELLQEERHSIGRCDGLRDHVVG